MDAKFASLAKVEAAGWQEEEVKKKAVVKKKTLPAGAGQDCPRSYWISRPGSFLVVPSTPCCRDLCRSSEPLVTVAPYNTFITLS